MKHFRTTARAGLVAGALLLGLPATSSSAAVADPADPIAGASVLGDPTVGLADYDGAFSLPAFISSGDAEGDMTIVADKGSVDLHLRSGALPGFAPAAGDYTFTWTVAGGTGSFDGLQAQGTLDIIPVPLFSDGPLVQQLVQIVQFGDPTVTAISELDSMPPGESSTSG